MALSLKPTLSLSGTAADLGATLSLTNTDNLTIKPPFIGITRQVITTASNQEIIDNAGINDTNDVFVYIKNTDSTNYVDLLMTDDSAFGQLHPGEFAFFPLRVDAGLEVKADTADCVIEWAYWTRG